MNQTHFYISRSGLLRRTTIAIGALWQQLIVTTSKALTYTFKLSMPMSTPRIVTAVERLRCLQKLQTFGMQSLIMKDSSVRK